MNKIELKPCPFCGGEATALFWVGGWIYCTHCGGGTGHYNTQEEAIEAWNRRVNDDTGKSN